MRDRNEAWLGLLAGTKVLVPLCETDAEIHKGMEGGVPQLKNVQYQLYPLDTLLTLSQQILEEFSKPLFCYYVLPIHSLVDDFDEVCKYRRFRGACSGPLSAA